MKIFYFENIIFSPNSLPSIDEIHFDQFTIQDKDLKTLLLAANHIKKLRISEGNIISNGPELPKGFLTVLQCIERLEIEDMNLTQAEVKEIIKAAPKLKSLLYTDDNWNDYDGLDDELNALMALFSSKPTRPLSPDSNTSEAPPTALTPIHDPRLFINFQPMPTEVNQFKYHGTEKNRSQRMLIEKLSQYFTLTKQNMVIIPKLQDGICTQLAYYFLTNSHQFYELIRLALVWNGKIETLTPELRTHFDQLYTDYIAPFNLNPTATPICYLGDALGLFLEHNKTGFILINPWHAITIHYYELRNSWIFYDPNHAKGPYEISTIDALLPAIEIALGHCVAVASQHPTMAPGINDLNKFLESGGLLILIDSLNTDEILTAAKSHKRHCLSNEALDGLFLRDISGMPSWILGVMSPKIPVVELTFQLLEYLITARPLDYRQQLQQSIELLSADEKQQAIACIDDEAPPDLSAQLIPLMQTAPNTALYERELQPWDKKKACVPTLIDYVLQIINPTSPKKRLIECTSTQDIAALRFAIMEQAIINGHQVFYAHSPEDLVCSAPHVVRQLSDNTGVLHRFGGRLHRFLEESRTNPIIIVNYANFSAADMVRFNGLLDDNRHADGTPVPKFALIIGLINTEQPDCYQGADFYSRFDARESCPFDSQELVGFISALPITDQNISDSAPSINLFHSLNWETFLLGYWVLNGDQLTYKEGALQQQIEAGATTINLQNGLWDNDEFLHFWQEAFFSGFIDYANKITFLPVGFNIVRQDGYDWERLLPFLRQALPNDIVRKPLNPNSLESFFKQSVIINQQLVPILGHIEAQENTTLCVQVTRTLSIDDWGRLLSHCKNHQVRLDVQCATGVEIPDALLSVLHPPASLKQLQPWDSSKSHPIQVIQSDDVDVTIARINQSIGYFMVIDISECSSADVLWSTDGKLDKDALTFQFNSTQSDVLRALASGENIILKGRFSEELADALAVKLLTERYKGSLLLISEDTSLLACLPGCCHQVTIEEKRACLGHSSNFSVLEPYLKTEPLCKLKARSFHDTLHPGAPTDGAWAGIRELTEKMTALQPFNKDTSVQETIDHTQQRVLAVNSVLEHQPFIFLAGLSGVGKTTFVTDELTNAGEPLYQGKQQIHAWASNNTNPGARKILFLDEANLGTDEWSLFEGLFEAPPAILFEGKCYPLTRDHKVIFAGNPHKYGDERILAPFFMRHGNAVVFEPLPLAVIYEKILHPVFQGSLLESIAAEISQFFLDVYQFLCEHSTTDVLISPRELQMMALLVSSYSYNEMVPDEECSLFAAKYYAHQLGVSLVPKSHRSAFNSQFKPERNLTKFVDLPQPLPSEFVVTPSRHSIQQQLNDLLILHEYRRNVAHQDIERYGGLGGLVIEGEPGIGKSEIISACLLTHGHLKVAEDQPFPGKPFYYMPASLQTDDKKRILLKAFDEGAVIIIDEINSSPMMEDLLNHLLMGKTPDGKRPTAPGFLVIGSQNPVTMAGRRAPSTALARRLISTELLPYPTEEMIEILLKKNLPNEVARSLVGAFEKQVAYAKAHHLTPAPTFRDVLKMADKIMQTNAALFQANQEMMHLQAASASDPEQNVLLAGRSRFSLFTQQNDEPEEDTSKSKRAKIVRQ